MNKTVLAIIFVICISGFVYDVSRWMQEGNRTIVDALAHYWWAVLFVVAFAIEVGWRRRTVR